MPTTVLAAAPAAGQVPRIASAATSTVRLRSAASMDRRTDSCSAAAVHTVRTASPGAILIRPSCSRFPYAACTPSWSASVTRAWPVM